MLTQQQRSNRSSLLCSTSMLSRAVHAAMSHLLSSSTLGMHLVWIASPLHSHSSLQSQDDQHRASTIDTLDQDLTKTPS